jgi:hypothetical protein
MIVLLQCEGVSARKITLFRVFSNELTSPEMYCMEVTRPKMLEAKGIMPKTA